jgi:hypothetical protein
LRLFNGLRQVGQLKLATPTANPAFVLTPDGHGGTNVALRSPTVEAAQAYLSTIAPVTAQFPPPGEDSKASWHAVTG